MTKPRTYPTAPVELPMREAELEPVPVEGCAGCAELDKVRARARVVNDQATITDANVLLRRHPDGH
ncbi:hypothetical protein [Streptomyces ambofaciens]|nr:hypothetical protein [Streptomyces ambofaciens]